MTDQIFVVSSSADKEGDVAKSPFERSTLACHIERLLSTKGYEVALHPGLADALAGKVETSLRDKGIFTIASYELRWMAVEVVEAGLKRASTPGPVRTLSRSGLCALGRLAYDNLSSVIEMANPTLQAFCDQLIRLTEAHVLEQVAKGLPKIMETIESSGAMREIDLDRLKKRLAADATATVSSKDIAAELKRKWKGIPASPVDEDGNEKPDLEETIYNTVNEAVMDQREVQVAPHQPPPFGDPYDLPIPDNFGEELDPGEYYAKVTTVERKKRRGSEDWPLKHFAYPLYYRQNRVETSWDSFWIGLGGSDDLVVYEITVNGPREITFEGEGQMSYGWAFSRWRHSLTEDLPRGFWHKMELGTRVSFHSVFLVAERFGDTIEELLERLSEEIKEQEEEWSEAAGSSAGAVAGTLLPIPLGSSFVTNAAESLARGATHTILMRVAEALSPNLSFIPFTAAHITNYQTGKKPQSLAHVAFPKGNSYEVQFIRIQERIDGKTDYKTGRGIPGQGPPREFQSRARLWYGASDRATEQYPRNLSRRLVDWEQNIIVDWLKDPKKGLHIAIRTSTLDEDSQRAACFTLRVDTRKLSEAE